MKSEKKKTKRRLFADFQTKYRRSSNFGYGSKRDRFAIAGDGELSFDDQNREEEDSKK